MESELNCSVCGNEYRNDNLPRLLTECGHSYCQICLDTMITEEEDGRYRVSCPEDQTVTYLDSNDVTQFPKNIALIKFIEGKKSHTNSSLKDQSLDLTKIQRQEDSHGDETEQQLINQIEKANNLSSSREEGLKEEAETSQENISTPKKLEYEMCLPHHTPMDIVCIVDMVRICSKCAIFGDHKGHECKSIEQIENEWQYFRQDILDLYSKKESLEKVIYNKETISNIWSIYEQSKRKYEKELSDKFKKAKDALRKAEEAANKQLEQQLNKAEAKIKEVLSMDPAIQEQYKSWAEKSFGMLLKTEECTFEQKLKNLYDYNNMRFLPQGQSILAKMQEIEQTIPSRISNITKSISIQSNDEILHNFDTFVKIQTFKDQQNIQSSKNKVKPAISCEESLLQSELLSEQKYQCQIIQTSTMPQKQEQFIPSAFETSHPMHSTQTWDYRPQPQMPYFKNIAGSFSSPLPLVSKERESYISEESPNALFLQKSERPPKKKLKLIKVPQKIEKTLELLYSDALDLLDLTNAELGDSTVLQICEFLKGTKVRAVKFIRNKLTDSCIPKMAPAMGLIITLNLSQNLLTERTLEHLINLRSSFPNLKSVILSQNKIIERKHKLLIDRLRSLDLIVSV